MNNTSKFFRSLIALLLVMASILPYGTYAFAAEEQTPGGQTTQETITREEADEVIDNSDLVVDLREEDPDQWDISELDFSNPDTTERDRIEALANEILYGTEATLEEEKPETRLTNLKDYVFLDFRIGTTSRNLNWQADSTQLADNNAYSTTWNRVFYYGNNYQGLLCAWLKGNSPSVNMPLDLTDTGKGWLGNKYKIQSGDIAQVRVWSITSGAMDFPGSKTSYSTGQSSLYINSSDGASNGWEEAFTGKIALHLSDQIQTFNLSSTTYVGDTLYGIRYLPLKKSGIVGDSAGNGYRINIDYIYIGPSSCKPVYIEYYDEGNKHFTVKNSDGTTSDLANHLCKGYVGYDQGAFFYNHGKTSTTTSVWGWEIYEKDINNNFVVNANKFILDPTTYVCKKDTRFVLKKVEIPSTNKISSTQGQSVYQTDEDKYVVTAEAVDSVELTASSTGKPLDITIVLDRTANMMKINNGSQTASSASALTTALNKLDKTKWAGYYCCAVWTKNWNFEKDDYNTTNDSGYIYHAPLRYYKNKWQAYILQNNCNCNKDSYRNYGREYGIYTWLSLKPCTHTKWVDVETARSEFYANRDAAKTLTGANFTNDFTIGVSRLGKVQYQLKRILTTLYDSNTKLPKDTYHRISILSYGQSVYVPGYPFEYETGKFLVDKDDSNNNIDLGVSIKSTEVNFANFETILKTLLNPYVLGRNNRIDVAMEALTASTKSTIETNYNNKKVVTASNYLPNSSTRKGICILVSYFPALKTDGTDTFDLGYANRAIAAAKEIKISKSTTIYSVCLSNGLNSTAQAYDKNFHQGTTLTGGDNYKGLCANTFRVISSNYSTVTMDDTKAKALPKTSTTNLTNALGTLTGGYFIVDMTSDNTNTIVSGFSGEWTSASKPTMKPTAAGGSASLWLHEEFQREWKLDPDRDLVVYALPHTGSGSYGSAVEIGRHNASELTTSPISGTGYKLYVTQKPNNEGFEISLQWLDAKKAYLRNSALSTGTEAKPLSGTLDVSKGYKIKMEIPLIVNRENTLGGNNIPINNDRTSGCYIAASGDTAKDTRFASYAQVNANVPVQLESESLDKYGFYDYFMTMEEYMNLHGAQATRSTGSAAADAYDKLMAINDNLQPANSSDQTRMDRVSFEIQLKNENGTVVYSKKAAQNATTLTEDKDDRATASNLLMSDTTFEGILKVTYNSGTTDSFGRGAYQDVNLNTTANFYAPKFAVVDFDGQMSVDLGNEAEVIDLTASNTGKNGSFNITNKTVTYDFRNTYGSSSEGKHMLNDIEEIAYTVKPKNHTIDGKTSVSRQVYILPGNVISYDDTIFSFFQDSYFDPNATQATDGKWVRVGTFTEMTQTADNSKVHGYDAAFATTRDYHGSSTVARPTSTVTAIAPMVINFYGTGFELLSRTAPECGAVMVEIYKNGAAKPVIGYLVDTYLANDTLYQIPIVQYLSNDPTPANYTVNVIPFYDKVFDHGQRALCTITEEEARALVGFDESVEFHYIPSPSVAPATREVTFANAYNVYVDGCRVYNPLAEDAQGIRNFVYALAGESNANILNINDQIVDVNSKVDWSTNEAQSGMLFVASQGTSSDSDDTITNNSHGFCLGMEGSLYELEVDGKFYVRTPDLEYILHGVYNTPIYYEDCKYNNPSHTIHFYCTDSNGDPILLTDKEVRKYVGNGERVSYYSAAYKALGPANEVYLSSGQGVAFQVGDGGARVFMSMKTVDGNAVTVQAYNGTAFENIDDLTEYCSDTEMYFDLTKYVKDGLVMIKNAGSGVLSLCNVKTASTNGTLEPKVSPNLLRMAVKAFNNEAELPIVDENVRIRHTLSLQSDISVNLVVPTAEVEGYDRFLMECTVAGETFFPEAVIKGDYIYFTVDGLTAVQMNENIHSVLHLVKSETEYTSMEDDYSIACYAYSILNREGVAGSIKSLCANLLRYGSLAQIYKGYQTDALADEEMTENHRSYLTDMETVVFGSNNRLLGDVTEPTVTWYGKSLVLDSKVTLQYVVNIDNYEGAMEDLSLRVTYEDINGSIVETELKEMQSYNEAMGLYSFKLDSLMAAELRTVVTAAVYVGDVQVSETLCYSADTYGNNKTGTLLDLCKALFAYSDTAKAYFAG